MTPSASSLLADITALSHAFGGPLYVKGGGGNTSCKTEATLWVKPSGTTLAGLHPDRFVALDRSRLRALYDLPVPTDAAAREALVKDAMAAAVCAGSAGRPSVEAPLHELLPHRFVVHTHSVLVNGMTCARDGESVCRSLFPEAMWIPYIDPGFTLCRDVHRRLAARAGPAPHVLVLENHGVFVGGDTPEDVRRVYDRLHTALEIAYGRAGIATHLLTGPAAAADAVGRTADQLRAQLGPDAAGLAADAPFDVARGPLTPDHIVYARAFPFAGAVTAEGLAEFRRAHGYAPRVVATSHAVFGLGATQRVADLALDLARDGALVAQLAAAFGGARFLSDAARRFIENWEVEAYRASQSA